MGKYILDFYCKKARLVVEIDGGQHYEADTVEYDKKRTNFLEEYGLKVIRFSNGDIYNNFEGVCTLIDIAVKERLESFGIDWRSVFQKKGWKE